jgi:hypothetical protein
MNPLDLYRCILKPTVKTVGYGYEIQIKLFQWIFMENIQTDKSIGFISFHIYIPRFQFL